MSASVLSALCTVIAVLAAGAALRRRPSAPRPLPRRVGADADLGAGAAEGAAAPARLAGRRRVVVVAAAVVALSAAIAIGPVLILAGGATAAGLRSFGRRRRVAAARRAVEASMPDVIELLVACLHAGRSPAQAIADMARLAPMPVLPAFVAVEQRLHRGHGLADALGELTTRCGTCALALVNAMSATVRDGLPLAPVLDRLTDEANAGRQRQGEAAARRLPVRLSFPLVVCTLPSFVLLSVAPAILGAVSSLRDSSL